MTSMRRTTPFETTHHPAQVDQPWGLYPSMLIALSVTLFGLQTTRCLAEPAEVKRTSFLYAEPVGVSRALGQIQAGAIVDTTGGRYGPWIEVRVKTGPSGWMQSLDLIGTSSSGTAPNLPVALTAPAAVLAKGAPPSAALEASLVSAGTPGMSELVRAGTFAVSTDTARGFGFSGGLELIKLPRAARRVATNHELTAPIEPTIALEKTMGQSFAIKQLAGRTLSADIAVQHYINLLGRWLSAESARPDMEWTFAVVDDGGFDAFSAPGGYVFVTQGLFDRVENEAELAGILAHEIAMVAGRFHLRGGLINTPVSADQLEADILATELCARTGIEANGLKALLNRLSEKGWFQKGPFQPLISRTPDPKARLAHLQEVMGSRMDSLEVSPTRRIPDRLNELKTQSLEASASAAKTQ